MMQTLGDAYKVLQLSNQSFSPFAALYMASLGAARALYLDNPIGNFVERKEADFIVLDASRTTIIQRRSKNTPDVTARLFAVLMLGDDRIVAGRYLRGVTRTARV
jgi:guanine deaminase